jgi:hypothetical protein
MEQSGYAHFVVILTIPKATIIQQLNPMVIELIMNKDQSSIAEL